MDMKSMIHSGPVFAIVVLITATSLRLLAEPLKIVANSDLKSDFITIDELRSVFLEETNSLRDGSKVEPVLQSGKSVHEAFLKEYLNRGGSELRTYYLGLAFTGKGSVPKEFRSDSEVIAYIAKTKGAIGYVSNTTSAEGVKTLLVIPDQRGGQRTLMTHFEPVYPEVLERHKIGGTVKLQLTISPSGVVESVIVLGGNPILGEAAVTAVKKWVYTASAKRTKAEVTVPFNPK
jgi:TonB family protein